MPSPVEVDEYGYDHDDRHFRQKSIDLWISRYVLAYSIAYFPLLNNYTLWLDPS